MLVNLIIASRYLILKKICSLFFKHILIEINEKKYKLIDYYNA